MKNNNLTKTNITNDTRTNTNFPKVTDFMVYELQQRFNQERLQRQQYLKNKKSKN